MFGYDQGVVSVTLTMDQFITMFPQVAPNAAGAGFQKGLLTAMIELGAFIGAMNQGWIADKISRKWSIMTAVLIFLLGSALQTGAMSFEMLLGARFVGGIGVGMLAMVAPLYISEIAPPEIRGTLLVMQELSIVVAIVVAFYTTYGTRFIAGEWSWRLPFLIQVFHTNHALPLIPDPCRADGPCNYPWRRPPLSALPASMAGRKGKRQRSAQDSLQATRSRRHRLARPAGVD
jgi:MFS family permease